MNAQHRINKLDNKLRRLDARINWLQNATDMKQVVEVERLRRIFVKTMQRKQALTGN